VTVAPTPERRVRWPVAPRPRRTPAVGHIPGELTAFVGPETDLARLRLLQAERRLLTLFGPNGLGKSRLARRLGTELREEYPDGTSGTGVGSATGLRSTSQVPGLTSRRSRPGRRWWRAC
jgi:hypothetical protein